MWYVDSPISSWYTLCFNLLTTFIVPNKSHVCISLPRCYLRNSIFLILLLSWLTDTNTLVSFDEICHFSGPWHHTSFCSTSPPCAFAFHLFRLLWWWWPFFHCDEGWVLPWCFLYLKDSSSVSLTPFPRWSAKEAKIEVPSAENLELSEVSSFEAWNRPENSFACFTCCQ